MSVCSLRNPACKAHAPYWHLWPVCLYRIFPHYFLKGTTFGKKVTEHTTRVLIFSTTFAWNISHSEENSARCYHKHTNVFMLSARCSSYVVMRLEFPWQIAEKYKCRFHENPCSGSRVAPFGRTDRRIDRRDEACSRFYAILRTRLKALFLCRVVQAWWWLSVYNRNM